MSQRANHNKLVPDRIPDIITAEGREYAIEIMDDAEYRQALLAKLVEEAQEVASADVGSAFGRGGLQGRLKHHLAPAKKPHWHIDYLRQAGMVCVLCYTASETRYELQWADTLRLMPGADVPVPRFGASDCKCEAHLSYLPDKPSVDAFCENNNLTLQCHSVKISQNSDHMEIEL
jgi:Uri superfamily endonuclease